MAEGLVPLRKDRILCVPSVQLRKLPAPLLIMWTALPPLRQHDLRMSWKEIDDEAGHDDWIEYRGPGRRGNCVLAGAAVGCQGVHRQPGKRACCARVRLVSSGKAVIGVRNRACHATMCPRDRHHRSNSGKSDRFSYGTFGLAPRFCPWSMCARAIIPISKAPRYTTRASPDFMKPIP